MPKNDFPGVKDALKGLGGSSGPDAPSRLNLLNPTCPVIENYKLPPIQIFDKNCPLKRENREFAIFRQNVRKLEPFW